MTSKEAKSILNEFRNRNYNSDTKENATIDYEIKNICEKIRELNIYFEEEE